MRDAQDGGAVRTGRGPPKRTRSTRFASQHFLNTEEGLPMLRSMLGMLIIVLCSGVTGSADAVTVEPSRPSQIVVLITGGRGGCGEGESALDVRVPPDGTAAQPFVIPTGQVFVVKGVDWGVNGLPGTSGDYVQALLRIGSGTHNVWADTSPRDPSGAAGKSSLVPDVIVRAGSPICFHAVFPSDPTTPVGSLFRLDVHGFFTNDR